MYLWHRIIIWCSEEVEELIFQNKTAVHFFQLPFKFFRMKKGYFSRLWILIACIAGMSVHTTYAQTTSFTTAGGPYTYTVPTGCSSLGIDIAGGQGGYDYSSSYDVGGNGGRVVCNLAVSGGQVLYVYVGGQGVNGTSCCSVATAGGTNGGGVGGYYYGGGGGGASDIRTNNTGATYTNATGLASRIIVGGGGGGGGWYCGENGGGGGGTIGGNGLECGSYNSSYAGAGGGTAAGGAGASYGGSSGTFGSGGAAYAYNYNGGGGAGWYGGGGAYGGSGGGGSSYAGTGTSSVTHTQGYRPGTGYAYITPQLPAVTSTPTALAFGGVTASSTSTPQYISLSGLYLTGAAITVTPPANYQVSPDGGSTWYTSSSPYTLTYSGSSFSGVVLAVEFIAPATTGSYSGNIAVTGAGLSTAYNIAVSGTSAGACSGTPTAGSATINGTTTASGNSSTTFALNAPSATVGGGITYQWMVSTTSSSGPFTAIPGAATAAYSYTGLTANSWFECVVTCGSNSATSSVVSATFSLPASGCTPSFSNTCSSYPMSTSINSLIGFSGSISDPSACGANYVDNSGSMTVTLLQNNTYNITYGVSTSYYSYFAVQLWIDFNDNGSFETSESVGGIPQSGCASATPTSTIVIPSTASLGTHRMRIVGIYYPTAYGYNNYPNMNPCPVSYSYGNARDYKVTIQTAPATITATPVANFGNVTMGTSSIPVGFSTLTGANLQLPTGAVTVTSSSSNFLVSSNGTSWGATASIPYSSGTLNNNVYVQFNPSAATSYSGNLAITGGGITSTVNVAVAGTGVSAGCSGTPTAGTAVVSPTSGLATTVFSLSLSGASANGGMLYQWQSAPASTGPWTNIAGGIYPAYSFSGLGATTYYRCIVTCVASNTSSTSATATATFTPVALASSSCTPGSVYASNACSSYRFVVATAGYPFTLTGESGTNINDNTACNGTGFLDQSSSLSVTLKAGGSYTCYEAYPTSTYTMTDQIWIDFNNNGTFETSEVVGGTSTYTASSAHPETISVPATVAAGNYRMRVIVAYASDPSNYPSIPACPVGSCCPTGYMYYSEARDYKVTIQGGAAPCSGTPLAGVVNGTPTTSCGSFTANLINVGENSSSGMVYQWQSSSSPTSGFTSISGATNAVYAPVLTTPGTIYYRDSVTCTISGGKASSPSLAITYNAAPTAITGTTTICNGANTTLASTPTGGSWSSSNSAVASTSGSTGIVTGTGAGACNITYTAPSGCITTTAFVTNPQPSGITGTTTFCGSQTTVLSSTPAGGNWTSSNTSVATTAGTASGTITGLPAGGTAIITYTLPTGCISSAPVTVNPLSAISGLSSICMGYGTSFTDATSGGTWSSSTPAIATINSLGSATSVSIGSTTISYSIPSTGCTATQVLNITAPPSPHSMTASATHFCTHGSGVVLGMSATDAGMSYQLYNGSTAIGSPVTSVGGGAITFGTDTLPGTYSVIAGSGACALTMPSTILVTLDPLPTPYVVSASGSGAYCSGGTGVHVYLNSSNLNINYQLFNVTTPVGSAVAGTTGVLDFGLQTTGSYTVVGTNTITGCVGSMSNAQIVTTNVLPSVYAMSASGGYCTGGSGWPVTLGGSTSGISYQLYVGSAPVGAPITGGGGSVVFGNQTVGGTYTVVATNTTTGCTSTMTGSTVVSVNPLPTVYTVTGGGAYCVGTTSTVHVGLNGSNTGINYQLFLNSASLGSTGLLSGSGISLDFGAESGLGAYTVVATNPLTTCSVNMTASAIVTTNPLPTAFTVTGGGAYCSGGSGVNVGLSGSIVGTNYYLYNGTTLVGSLSGTGSTLNFGAETASGTSYNVSATNSSTGCNTPMSGSVAVVINPLPVAYAVGGGGAYCAGGIGSLVTLSNSQSGVSYQLFRSGTAIGSTVPGTTGTAVSMGYQTVAGSYTIVATSTASPACNNNMLGSAAVSINSLPTVYPVVGGGSFCTGSTGVHVGLSGSDIGTSYQLYNGSTASGLAASGVGGPLDFGIEVAGGTYTVVATNVATSCSVNSLPSSVSVVVNPLPNAYAITPSTAGYCGTATGAPLTLSSSDATVNYQVYNGTALVNTVSGSGTSLSLGTQPSGTYHVVATNPSTGCTANMTGTSVVTAVSVPVAYSVTGGGTYCAGSSSTTHVGLAASQSGVSYQLYNNGSTSVGIPVLGSGASIDFGAETLAGTYTVIGSATGCSNNMSGTARLTVNPAPTAYTLSAASGGLYCIGGAGVDVTLSSSSTGINYQLFVGGTASGTVVSGSGSAIDFGTRSATGTYSVVASNTSTGCTATMTGSPVVANYPAATSHNVTGGGSYCPTGSGMHIGLDSSTTGTNYQVYNGTVAVGSLIGGSGGPIDFGAFSTPSTYTVIATNPTTHCQTNMAGSATVAIYSLPVVYAVTGGGNYCAGGTGSHIGLGGSAASVNYQLYYDGTITGSSVAGTGSTIDFGPETSTGTYTVVATGALTGCSTSMSGSLVVGINPLPTAYGVTGGGNYCIGGTGVHIGLGASVSGISYQLYRGGTPIAGTSMPGTGSALDFGLQTTTGAYSIVATNSSTGCTATMTGGATIGTTALPAAYNVLGGGSFCSGGLGVDVSINNSDVGVTYQLYNGTATVGSPISGTGSALDLGIQTAGGTYTVVATNSGACTNGMTGSANIVVNPLPVAYNVTGGGNYCAGTSGAHVTLDGSATGFTYQLYIGGSSVGLPIAGTGYGLDFGAESTPGVYTVIATNTSTACQSNMTGSTVVNHVPAPSVYAIVGHGSSYCAGGSGIDMTLSGSQYGISYQMYNGTAAIGSPIAGTGAALDLGYQTSAGSYTVVALNSTTGCVSNMGGVASVMVNALPAAFTVTGGGAYCTGSAGVHIGLASSNAGMIYQLYTTGGGAVGLPVSGTGAALDFGDVTSAGSYYVTATNSATLCSSNMSGITGVTVNPLPTSYTVTGGGNYCAGGTGEHIGLAGSTSGIKYQLYSGGTAVGTLMTGTGSALDFGSMTAAGSYTVVASNPGTSCTNNMSGTAAIAINPAPNMFTVTGGGSYCDGGTGVHIGLISSNSGISYQLYDGSGTSGSSMSGTGTTIDFGTRTAAGTYTVKATNGSTGCTATMTGGTTVVINPLPAVYSVMGGGNYCAGGSGVHIGLGGSESGVSYQMYDSSLATGVATIGTGGALDLGSAIRGGVYTIIATNSYSCSSTMTGTASVVVNPLVTPFVTVSTGTGDTLCSGSLTTFTAVPVNGGTSPTYQWAVNGVPVSSVSNSYAYLPNNGDVVTATLTSDAQCATPAVVNGNMTLVVEDHQVPSIVVSANPGAEVCQGTMVTYNAAATYGGSSPSYAWIQGSATVSTAASYSYVPSNGDVVYCVLTSNYKCRLATTAISNHISMQVDVPSTPSVTIVSNPAGTIAPGENVTFTAVATGAGSGATYQWYIDGGIVTGATGSTFETNNLNNNDSVTCVVTSGGGCAGMTGAASVTIHTTNVGVQQVSASGSDVQIVPNPNKGQFVVKGSLATNVDQDVTLELTDMLGQIVYTTKVTAQHGALNERIQLGNNIANGMYLLNLRTDSGNMVFHVVVEQ
jgi:GEVED domain/Secretion system C-terminal sorting domain